MDPVFEDALVINTGAGVNDHVISNAAARVHDRSCRDDRPVTDPHITRDHCTGMNRGGEFEPVGMPYLGQMNPRSTVTHGNDKVSDPLVSQSTELLAPSDNGRT